MTTLSELIRRQNNTHDTTVGSSQSAVGQSRTLSELIGNTKRQVDTVAQRNQHRQAREEQQRNEARTAAWVENRQKEAFRTRPRPSKVDDTSLAHQMLKDRAETEKMQQLSQYADTVKSFIGTPAQDAYEEYRKQHTDYSAYLQAPDFEQYSHQGANMQNPSFADAQGKMNLFGWRPSAEQVGNIVTFSRDNSEEITRRLESDDKSQFVGDALYTYMTDDEVSIYNYLLAKEGNPSAQRYLDSITEQLRARYGKHIAEDVEKTKGTVLHPLAVAGVATSTGLDRYAQDIKQLGEEYRLPTSTIQFAGQEVRDDQGFLGRAAYDVVHQVSHQAPSILVGSIAGALGAPAVLSQSLATGSVGLASAGGTYQQALAEGRSKEEAKTVATLVGTSEAVLSKLLSGIGAYGGVSAEKLLPKVAAIENAAWRVLGATGVKLGGEVVEEEMQNFLEPLFRTIVYGDQYDAPTSEELAYTAFITALSTGLLEGGEIAQYRTSDGARRAVGTTVTDADSEEQSVTSEREQGKAQGNADAPVDEKTKRESLFFDALFGRNKKTVSALNTEKETQSEKTNTTDSMQPGFYTSDRFHGSTEDAAYLDRLAKAVGVSIEMAAASENSNGWIVNGRVYISENADDPVKIVAKHEITHHLKDVAGETYNQYRKYVAQIYQNRGTLEQRIEQIIQLYEREGQNLTREQAMDELAADFAGNLLDNEVLIRKLAGEDRTLAKNIFDAIQDVIRRIKTMLSGREVQQLDRAARLWESALEEANAGKNRDTTSSKIRYSFKDTNIDRMFLEYNDVETTADAIADTASDIRRDGASVSIRWEDVERYASELDWSQSNQRAARKFIQKILTDVLGDDSVAFSIKNGTVVAHLTGKGKDHYTGYATPQKAAVAKTVRELLGTARYAYSTRHDEHSKIGSSPTGQPGWDNFVAVVQITGGPYHGETVPFVIATREIESDQRAQIYDMQIKTEMATSREGVPADAGSRSSYGGFTISAENITRNAHNIKDFFEHAESEERKSVKGVRDLQKQIDALERQNQRLKEQMKRTDAPKQNREAVRLVAAALRQEFGSKIDEKELTDLKVDLSMNLRKMPCIDG